MDTWRCRRALGAVGSLTTLSSHVNSFFRTTLPSFTHLSVSRASEPKTHVPLTSSQTAIQDTGRVVSTGELYIVPSSRLILAMYILHVLLPTGSEEWEVLRAASIPVAILPSCRDMKANAL